MLAGFATVPLMACYGWVTSIPVLFLLVLPHGLGEAVESPGTQAALADAAPRSDAAAAQGLGEAAGSAAAAIGAFTSAPLYAWAGPGAAWLTAGVVMAGLLTVSTLLDRPVRHDPGVGAGADPGCQRRLTSIVASPGSAGCRLRRSRRAGRR